MTPSRETLILLLAGCLLASPTHQAHAARKRKRPYKRIHRQLVTLMAAGKHEAAAEGFQADLAKDPNDLESLYGLALAHANRKEMDKAMAAVRHAVQAGLPIGRFLAGPRHLARPLVAHEAFRSFLKARRPVVIHGPMLGAVTDGGARFWLRTAEEASVEVRAFPAGPEVLGGVCSGTARTARGADYTAVVEVAGLKPDTPYTYTVRVNGEVVKDLPLARPFRTFPAAGSKRRFQIAFGGGAGYTPWRERMWDTIAGRKPLALLMLGDNVYIDTPKVPPTQRYCYYRRQSRAEWRRLTAATCVYAIWDDHDFGTDDCLSTPHVDQPPWKLAVWGVFRENWVNPYYGGGRKRPGCWFHFAIADVDFIMLDGRYYRTRGREAGGPTMLGPDQKKWLFEKLRNSKATFKVLASPVPWAEGTKGRSRDTWDGFPAEREEIFSFIESSRIGGVFLISADRHRSDVWKTDRPTGYTLYEANSSKLTNVHTHGSMKGALFSYNKKCSYGLLTFDTTKPDPEITYRIINIDDEVVHTFTVRKSQLRFKQGN